MRVRTGVAAVCLVYAGMTGCGSGDGDSEAADSGLTFEDGVELPDSWPDDVPLVDGEVTWAEEQTDYHGWPRFTVMIDSEKEFDAVVDETLEGLADAGLTSSGDDYTDTGYHEARLDSEDYQVEVAIQEADGEDREALVGVSYNVVVLPDEGLEAPDSVAPFADGLIYDVQEGQPLVVSMLVDGEIDQVVADVEAQLTAAGFPTNPNYPPTQGSDGTYFTASAPKASIEVRVATDDSTGRTDLSYRVWVN